MILAALVLGSLGVHLLLGALPAAQTEDAAIANRKSGRTSVAVRIVAYQPPQPNKIEHEPVKVPDPRRDYPTIKPRERLVELTRQFRARPQDLAIVAREMHSQPAPTVRRFHEPAPIRPPSRSAPTPQVRPESQPRTVMRPIVRKRDANEPKVTATIIAQQSKGARTPPTFVSRPDPPYPRELLIRGIEGSLRLRVEIGVGGRPRTVEVAQSSGYTAMDQSAVDTVKRYWKFTPAKRGGAPIVQRVIVPVNFRIRR